MVYQELYLGNPPYILGTRHMTYCYMHRHPEIELLYCIEGTCDVIIDRTRFTLNTGDVAIIGSMVSHEVPETESGPDAIALVVEVGPLMLGNFFNMVANETFSKTVVRLNTPEHSELHSLFEEIVSLKSNPTKFSNLMINGNIYRICSIVFENFAKEDKSASESRNNNSVTAIANALEYIYANYNKKFTVDTVAEMCGYSKSNFCKIFKNITGDTFHNVLNKHRVKIACALIKNGELSLDEVASQVGFADGKSFHKVFKSIMGVTPGMYKKKN